MRIQLLAAPVLLLCTVFGGCGGSTALAASDLFGAWQEVGVAEHGHVVEFDGKSTKFLVHGPGAGGHDTHDHFAGQYEVRDQEVVLTGAWESNDKAEVVRGTLRDGTLQLRFAAKPIDFRRR